MRFLACALAVAAVVLTAGCSNGGLFGSTSGYVGGSGGAAVGSTVASSGDATSGTSGIGGSAGTTSSNAGSSSAGSSGGSGGSGGSRGTGGYGGASSNSGDCATDADCPGGACVALTPGGFRVCQTLPTKATVCSAPALDQCCAGMSCAGGAPCYAGPLIPICAGIPMPPHNQCAVDQCAADADCASGEICGLAGTLGASIRHCLPAACKHDGDCAARAGGKCAPVNDPCCGVSVGLYCVYPGGCRGNADCAPTTYCEITGTSATCQAGAPVCPQ